MDAAYVNGKIYVPTGWVGDNDEYDGTFWAYDIDNDTWYVEPDQPGDDPGPARSGRPQASQKRGEQDRSADERKVEDGSQS